MTTFITFGSQVTNDNFFALPVLVTLGHLTNQIGQLTTVSATKLSD